MALHGHGKKTKTKKTAKKTAKKKVKKNVGKTRVARQAGKAKSGGSVHASA